LQDLDGGGEMRRFRFELDDTALGLFDRGADRRRCPACLRDQAVRRKTAGWDDEYLASLVAA
jgi:hypothetical protein